MSKRITITLPDHLMNRIDYFCKLHSKNAEMSDAAKLRFVISFGLKDYVPSDPAKEWIQHGGKRKGAGRKGGS